MQVIKYMTLLILMAEIVMLNIHVTMELQIMGLIVIYIALHQMQIIKYITLLILVAEIVMLNIHVIMELQKMDLIVIKIVQYTMISTNYFKIVLMGVVQLIKFAILE